MYLSAGGLEWPGSTHASGVWFEYTGTWYTVYDLTTVSSMVDNIGPHPESAQNHSFLALGGEKLISIFGSESNSNAQVYSRQVNWGSQNDGLMCNWVYGFYWVIRVKYDRKAESGTDFPVAHWESAWHAF